MKRILDSRFKNKFASLAICAVQIYETISSIVSGNKNLTSGEIEMLSNILFELSEFSEFRVCPRIKRNKKYENPEE